MYHVNGYKFHIVEWERGKKTDNTGVCVRGDTGDEESDWHGVVNEILELEYPSEPIKRVVLFACEWYNPTRPRGIHKHNHYKIIEINHTKKVRKIWSIYHRPKCKTSLLLVITWKKQI